MRPNSACEVSSFSRNPSTSDATRAASSRRFATLGAMHRAKHSGKLLSEWSTESGSLSPVALLAAMPLSFMGIALAESKVATVVADAVEASSGVAADESTAATLSDSGAGRL